MIPKILVIGDSDPSGGAGIQADLKAIAAQGAYACTVVTVLTAQNTRGVAGAFPIPADFIKLQLETLAEEIQFKAIKVGVLPNAEIVEVVSDFVAKYPDVPLVLDPVLVGKTGRRLVDDEAVAGMRELARSADLVTPNLAGAARLLEQDEATTVDEMVHQARALLDLGIKRVVIKGGHLDADATDIFADANGFIPFTTKRLTTGNMPGTGSSLTSAITALYVEKGDWGESVRDAKQWLTCALENAKDLEVSPGSGPVNHFYCWW